MTPLIKVVQIHHSQICERPMLNSLNRLCFSFLQYPQAIQRGQIEIVSFVLFQHAGSTLKDLNGLTHCEI